MDTARHADKTVLITGGAGGIGRETALRFAREGASHVCLIDRADDGMSEVSEDVAALGAACTTLLADLAIAEECVRAVDAAHTAAGRLDVVIANAATVERKPFLEIEVESWEQILAVNLTAAFLTAQRATAHGLGQECRRDPLYGVRGWSRRGSGVRPLQRVKGRSNQPHEIRVPRPRERRHQSELRHRRTERYAVCR